MRKMTTTAARPMSIFLIIIVSILLDSELFQEFRGLSSRPFHDYDEPTLAERTGSGNLSGAKRDRERRNELSVTPDVRRGLVVPVILNRTHSQPAYAACDSLPRLRRGVR